MWVQHGWRCGARQLRWKGQFCMHTALQFVDARVDLRVLYGVEAVRSV